MGQFLFAAKAFDVLERLDPDPEYWEGKRGACIGVFQQIIASQTKGIYFDCHFRRCYCCLLNISLNVVVFFIL